MASTTAAPTSPATQAAVPSQGASAIPLVISSDGFLKPGSPRKRRRSPEGADSPAKGLEGQIRDKLGITSPTVPVELTGAAEMAEQKRRKLDHSSEVSQGTGRQQSANPHQQALSTLRGANTNATSRPRDAPHANSTQSTTPNEINASMSAQTSPASNASFNTAASANANPAQVASPAQIGDNEVPGEEDVAMGSAISNTQTASPKSYSYPDPSLSTTQVSHQGRRDLSLPGATTSDDTRSPASNKKHKCPYCETEFTRHHNLKSHLLTHSQEKPFLCEQCDMRFRRLHDLKRHTKLHTGERPHVCPICNRKFARGDALARHTKGAGGCAGHRSSVSSFTNEASHEGEIVIDSLMYAGEPSQEPSEIDDTDGPSKQLRNSQYQGTAPGSQGRPSSTYPPVAGRSSQFLQTPNAHGNGTASPAASHPSYGQAGHQGSYPPPPNSFGPSNISESPAPISPSTGHHPSVHDPRRSSNNQQLRHYVHQGAQGHVSPQSGSSGPAPTATMSLPPPQAAPSSVPAPNPATHFSQLPPTLPSISTDARAPHVHTTNTSGPLYQSTPGSASTHNSLSSHGQSSGERAALGIDERDRLWAFINSLRSEMSDLRDKYDNLVREFDAFKHIQKAE